MTGHEVREVIRRDFNLNTVVALVGFLSLFATIIAAWTGVQFRLDSSDRWVKAHEELHAQLKADGIARTTAFDVRLNGIDKEINELDALVYRVTSNEKNVENLDVRITRISENYSSQFSDMRTQLASIATQLALANQALLRVEKASADITPPALRGGQ